MFTNCTTKEEVYTILNSMTKAQLLEVAEKHNVPTDLCRTKEEIKHNIFYTVLGFKLRAKMFEELVGQSRRNSNKEDKNNELA